MPYIVSNSDTQPVKNTIFKNCLTSKAVMYSTTTIFINIAFRGLAYDIHNVE